MPRAARKAPGGQVYHVLNRSVGKMHLFGKDADFEAFQRVMIEAHQRHSIRILSYCVLSNHWHFAVWPDADGQVTAFFRWLAHTYAMRWRVAHRTVGCGHLDQGRFKSFPVQSDEHLLTVLRYIERNAVGAGLVARAKHWRWRLETATGWKQGRSYFLILAASPFLLPLLEQRREAGLLVVMIACQCLLKTLFLHHHEWDAIGQRPLLVATLVVQYDSLLE